MSPWYGVTCNKVTVSIKRVTGIVDCGVDCSRLLPVAPLGNCKSIGSVPPGSCPSVPDIPLIVTPAPLPFFKKKKCNTQCKWWRVLMNSDSRWLSNSWDLFTDPAIHNAYHTPLHSVALQMCSARHDEDKKGSDKHSWEQTLIWVWALIQIRASCTSRQTRTAHYAQQSTLTDPLHQACGTNKRKNNQDAATRQQPERTTSSTWANTQTWLHFSICACHPNILPILSRDGHITQLVTVWSV